VIFLRNYEIKRAKKISYVNVNDPLEAVEQEYEVPPLPNNPTLAQIKNHKVRKQRKSKVIKSKLVIQTTRPLIKSFSKNLIKLLFLK